MGAGNAYSIEDLRRTREALRQRDANDSEFASLLKVHLEKLASQFKDHAIGYHRWPPEEKDALERLRRELHDIYDDLWKAQGFLDIAHTILTDRTQLDLIGAADAALRSLLYDEYGAADMYLSAAGRTAAQYGGLQATEALQMGANQILAEAARNAVNAYLRFAVKFEQVAKVIRDLAAAADQRKTPGGTHT